MDPRYQQDECKDSFLALYVSIKWYSLIEAEQAFRILRGESTLQARRRTSLEIAEGIEIQEALELFWNRQEKKYCLDRYNIANQIKNIQKEPPI